MQKFKKGDVIIHGYRENFVGVVLGFGKIKNHVENIYKIFWFNKKDGAFGKITESSESYVDYEYILYAEKEHGKI